MIITPPPAAEPEAPAPTPTPSSSGLSPLHTVLGGIVIAGVLAAVFMGGSGDDEEVEKKPPIEIAKPPPKPPEPSAKAMVDKLVADKAWSTQQGVESFLRRWEALSEEDREVARSAPWFVALVTEIKQDINAQLALAGLTGDSTAAKLEGRRLVDFAKAMKITGPFPAFEIDKESSDASVADASSDTTSSIETSPPSSSISSSVTNSASSVTTAQSDVPEKDDPEADTTAQASQSGDDTPVSLSLNATDESPPAASWIGLLPEHEIMIQLAVVSQSAAVERLMERNSSADLKALLTPAGQYHVLVGPYRDQDTAREEIGRAHV